MFNLKNKIEFKLFFIFLFFFFNMFSYSIFLIPIYKYFCSIENDSFFYFYDDLFFYNNNSFFYYINSYNFFFSNLNLINVFFYNTYIISNSFIFDDFYNNCKETFFFFLSNNYNIFKLNNYYDNFDNNFIFFRDSSFIYYNFFIFKLDRLLFLDWITLCFLAKVTQVGLLEFKPLQSFTLLVPGETTLIFFRLYNPTNLNFICISYYLVFPNSYSIYITKLQCFCFDTIFINKFESIELPVLFFFDNSLINWFTFGLKIYLYYLILVIDL